MADTTETVHPMRIQVDVSNDWAFVKRNPGRRWLREGSEPGDEVVDLPHSWNSRDTFQAGASYYRGHGAYRKVFQMPSDVPYQDYLWSVKSEGFYGTGDVWLNGRKLGAVDGQYLGFDLATRGYLPFDTPSILGIRLTNRCRSHVLPGIDDPDFLLYGGLAGKVWVAGVPKFHLDRDAVRIVTESLSPSRDADVAVHFAVANGWDNERNGSVSWAVEDGAGQVVAAAEPMALHLDRQSDSGELSMKLRVTSPRLWSPAGPALYAARWQLKMGTVVVDEGVERFGIRTPEFRPRQGFFLNGERLELRGCNRHESMPGFGSALPANLHREDAAMIKNLGLNFVRLSHCPQHPAFLDACDELGILVYAELASWKSVRSGRWLTSACRQMHDMIVRDRNRPSVILWGMGNESRSRRAYLRLREQVRELDATRPVTYAENHHHRAVRERTVGIPDVWGLNYELEVIDAGVDASVLKNVIVSECSNFPPAVRGDLEREAEQVGLIDGDLKKLEGKPAVAGFALWCLNDYATMRKERYNRHCGLVDAWRVPKMSAAFLKAKYARDPFIKVFGNWGQMPGPETGQREMHIFTNCDPVHIARNGVPVATVAGAAHLVQPIAFEPGRLTFSGSRDGREACYELMSFGDASRVDLKLEKADGDAEQRETLGVVVRITDDAGQVVTPWNGKARVTVEGAAYARTYRQDNVVDIAGGLGRFFITANGKIGVATLKVSCETLAPAAARASFH